MPTSQQSNTKVTILTLCQPPSGNIALHYVKVTVSQPCRHHWHVDFVLGMWFHAIQLSTTFIPSRKFVYLVQCSAVDIQTHSFTVQTVPASLPAVRQHHPRLTHFWLFLSVMKGLSHNFVPVSLVCVWQSRLH